MIQNPYTTCSEMMQSFLLGGMHHHIARDHPQERVWTGRSEKRRREGEGNQWITEGDGMLRYIFLD